MAEGRVELFEARLTNQAKGEYKGYFITEEDLTGKLAWVGTKLRPAGGWDEPIR